MDKTRVFQSPIPDEYAIGLGHVISTWAAFEYEVHRLTCAILGLGLKAGRQLVPRVSGLQKHFKLLFTVARLEGVKLPAEFANLNAKSTFDLETRRNWLAHCLWAPPISDSDSVWCIRISAGDLPAIVPGATKEQKAEYKSMRSPKEMPVTVRIQPKELKSLAVNILARIAVAKVAADKIEKLRRAKK
jgi:hypothetical protein